MLNRLSQLLNPEVEGQPAQPTPVARAHGLDPELFRASGVFREDWYRRTYPDIPAELDAFQHFMDAGLVENRSPHPLYDATHYLGANPDVAATGRPGFEHYFLYGSRERRQPHPVFDVQGYVADRKKRTGDEPANPLADFCGEADSTASFVFFDPAFYAERSGLADLHPNRLLEHFLTTGLTAGLDPHPLIQLDRLAGGKAPAERARAFAALFYHPNSYSHLSTHPAFDVGFYLRRHGPSGVHPVIHYLSHWRTQTLWPNALFDTAHYLAKVPLETVRPDPLSQYLAGERPPAEPNAFFDTLSYRAKYGQVIPAGTHPFVHYLQNGGTIWFDPGPRFASRFYRSRAADLGKSDVNLLEHYLHYGREHGLQALPTPAYFDELEGLSDLEIAAAVRALPRPPRAPVQVAIVIPVYKNVQYTLKCLHSVLTRDDRGDIEVLIVDDRSPDDSGAWLQAQLAGVAGVSVRVNEENLGFLRSCNGGVAATSAPFVLLLNNDTIVTDGWLHELLGTFERVPEAGLVGSKLLYPDGLLQEAGGVVWRGGAAANYGRMDDPRRPEFNYMRDVDYVSGAAILVKREAWDRVGGFSDELAPAYYEDTDITMKLRAAGYRVLYQPLSEVIHLEGISSGTDLSSGVKRFQEINKGVFAQKWADVLAGCGEPGDLSLANVDRAARGRILFYDALTPRPDEDSGSVTTFEYLRLLSELGYRVTFVSEHLEWAGAHARDLQRLGVKVVFHPYASSSKQYIQDTIDEYDLAILSRAPIGGRLLPFVRNLRPDLPIVFDTVDLHYRRMLREYALSGDLQMHAAAAEMKTVELNAIRFSDLTLLVSDAERRFLTEEIGTFPSLVIPLILRPAPPGPGYRERRDVAFFGGYRHTPNVDAVRYLVEEIWPLFRDQVGGARLHIIGSHMPPSFAEFEAEDVKLVGHVKDLDGYLSKIRMTVAPLRYGAGVKGKVANSLRLGVPAVISPAAAEGMPMIHGRNVLIAEDPTGFAGDMARLYGDEALWGRLADAGRETIEGWVGVEPARAKLKAMCAALIEARRQAA